LPEEAWPAVRVIDENRALASVNGGKNFVLDIEGNRIEELPERPRIVSSTAANGRVVVRYE